MPANQKLLIQEILDEIDNLNTWDCQFSFPYQGTITGHVDLCNFVEFKGIFFRYNAIWILF